MFTLFSFKDSDCFGCFDNRFRCITVYLSTLGLMYSVEGFDVEDLVELFIIVVEHELLHYLIFCLEGTGFDEEFIIRRIQCF